MWSVWTGQHFLMKRSQFSETPPCITARQGAGTRQVSPLAPIGSLALLLAVAVGSEEI